MAEGFKDRYAEHMVGRNGGDALSRTCLIVAIVLVVLSFFCVGVNPFLYVLVLLLGIAAAVYAALRMNSQDVAARQAENEAFLSLFKRIGRKDEEGEDGERQARASRRPRRERVEREYVEDEPMQESAPEPEPEPEPEPQAQPEKVTVTCDSCGQHLRVPAGKGNIKVRCPKCSNVFQLFT